MIATESEKHKILFINFNQDSSCICLGTEEGFIIYNIQTFQDIANRSKHKLIK